MASDGTLRFFEDIEPGETHRSGPYRVTHEAVRAFALMYDPQPFHLDEAAAEASVLGGLSTSGWHSCAIGMRLYFDGFVKYVASMGAPGVDEGRWLRPVRPGDDLTLHIAVPATRPSASRPDRGFISVELDLRNGADESVMTQRFSMMVQRRGAAQAPRPAPAIDPALQAPPPPPVEPTLSALWDEIEVGKAARLGSQLFTPDLIIGFARDFDPQYFHLDAVRAKDSHFGGLVASGWQTAALWMKSYIAARTRADAARAAAGQPVANAGPSPGFAKMTWHRPVHAGETIHYALTVIGKRALGRPGWGLLTTENTGRASDGTTVFSFEGRLLWPMAG